MTFDCCGNELYTGDVVVYSTMTPELQPVLEVYVVTELIDKDTCKGFLMSTMYAGIELYLTDTINRAACVSVLSPGTEDDEGDELPLSDDFN